MSARMMPIMSIGYRYDEQLRELRSGGVQSVIIAVPWAVMQPHEAQAQRNHGQSLARLAERGGLSACEAVAILEDRRHQRMGLAVANERLRELVEAAVPVGAA